MAPFGHRNGGSLPEQSPLTICRENALFDGTNQHLRDNTRRDIRHRAAQCRREAATRARDEYGFTGEPKVFRHVISCTATQRIHKAERHRRFTIDLNRILHLHVAADWSDPGCQIKTAIRAHHLLAHTRSRAQQGQLHKPVDAPIPLACDRLRRRIE